LEVVARRPRGEFEGAVFHVTARGVRKSAIFRDDRDRFAFLLELRDVVARTGWLVLAYCLMTTHYHLAVKTPRPNLGVGMCRLNGRHAKFFNRRHALEGHAFQSRYWSVPVVRDSQLLELTRYIALNPVRAGMCEAPEEWRWGSHAALAAGDTSGWLATAETLGYFAANGGDGCERYVRFVEA
jgi:putative transposase